MKTRTLVIAAGIVGVLMGIQLIPRGQFKDGLVLEAVADDVAVADNVAEAAQPAAVEALAVVEDPAAEDAAYVEYAQANADADEEPAEVVEMEEDVDPDLIELNTERELAPGIEVSSGDEGRDLISITLDNVPL